VRRKKKRLLSEKKRLRTKFWKPRTKFWRHFFERTTVSCLFLTIKLSLTLQGKPHKDILKAIRNMEPAWESECGRKFSLTSERVDMPRRRSCTMNDVILGYVMAFENEMK